MTTDFNHGGQMIEYIQGWYNTVSTLRLMILLPVPEPRFPSIWTHPNPQASVHVPSPPLRASAVLPVYFTVDDTLLYNAFHADFGPLHIGHLYRFAVLFHEILGDPANSDRPVVFYSKTDARSRANAACLVACYMVMIQSWPPHLALAPIARADPPYMPFHVVYGVWKAKEQSLCGLRDFNLEEYEKFERVDMGDFNWITPDFLAFASPQQQPVAPIPVNSPSTTHCPQQSLKFLPQSFPCHSRMFSPISTSATSVLLYDSTRADGTCPPLQLVRRFIKMAHEMITIKKKGIAVHCKGRSGPNCLHEIHATRYGRWTSAALAPPQPRAFREWWFEDSMREKLAQSTPVTPRVSTKKRTSSGVVSTPQTIATPNAQPSEKLITTRLQLTPDQDLPAPTPGQPRKSHRKDSRHHPYSRTASGSLAVETEQRGHRSHRKSNESSESEEEIQLRRLAQRSSRSPVASPTSRSISYSATVTASYTLTEDNHKDQENWVDHSAPKTPVSRKSGAAPISVSKVRSSPRRAAENTRSESRGVRKPSGRIGSNTISPARAIKTIH
ncbi:uncharacterized protein N7500_007551 [Penicillium coprophilum]|uniref:uncharacterized protein n=1 Tax=Penicillium coprophilum TaxID=36646 RepID=UPI00239F47EB|nr:uncharacterized protein N7500_007551 [Penicillium coprophilum]KAJ5165721.1 hypothetical protein N7500_007551 [Penicillium coprophilum]